MGRIHWRGVDASLDSIFYLGAAVAVAWTLYELVTRRKVVNGSLAQGTGGTRGSRRGLHKGKAQGQEGERRKLHCGWK